MTTFKSIIENLEQLVYDILLWIILVPKTLVKILTDPVWAHNYVYQELDKEPTERFDDYMSPVILLLFTALLPSLVFDLIPRPGVRINGPEEGLVGIPYKFTALGDFLWSRGDITYTFKWMVQDQANLDDYLTRSFLDEQFGEKDSCNEIKREEETDLIQIRTTTRTVRYRDKISDSALFSWETVGGKLVSVCVTNDRGEVHVARHLVERIEPVLSDQRNPAQIEPEAGPAVSQAQQEPADNLTQELIRRLGEESSAISYLLFLSIPLFFSFLIKIFQKEPVTRSSLQPIFFIQCYLFSPLYLSYWARDKLGYFMEDNLYGTAFDWALGGIFLFIVIWFLKMQAFTLMVEGIPDHSIFVFLFVAILIPGALFLGIFVFTDYARYFGLTLFVLASFAVIAKLILYLQHIRSLPKGETDEVQTDQVEGE